MWQGIITDVVLTECSASPVTTSLDLSRCPCSQCKNAAADGEAGQGPLAAVSLRPDSWGRFRNAFVPIGRPCGHVKKKKKKKTQRHEIITPTTLPLAAAVTFSRYCCKSCNSWNPINLGKCSKISLCRAQVSSFINPGKCESNFRFQIVSEG